MLAGLLDYVQSVYGERLQWDRIEMQMIVAPVMSYWTVALFYELLDLCHHPLIDRCRVVRRVKVRGNSMTKLHVMGRVLQQHALQVSLACTMLLLDPHQCTANPAKGWLTSASHFIIGMVVMDTWQYFIHRWMHVNTFLYKHLHSHHHRLNIPYASGALYNHPVEALLLDSVGAVVSQYASGMGCEVTMWFFSFASIKTVLDHSGYRFPLNPLHDVFPNNAVYHDVHHDVKHIKRNFSQPFFTCWDVILGTYYDPSGFHLEKGGTLEDTCLPGDQALVQEVEEKKEK